MSDNFFTLISDLPHISRSLHQRAVLFEQGDPVVNLYRLDAGAVHLLRRQLDGAEFILQRGAPGAMIAEASLMTESYHCAAEAMSPARVTYWPRDQIRTRMAKDSQLANAYAAHLATEVRIARLRAEIASLRRIADRLDAWLIWHDDTLPAKGQWHVVAQEINVTSAALYRELARRRKEGVI